MLFSSWLRNWKRSLEHKSALRRTRRRRLPARRHVPRLFLEALEDRTLLSTYLVTNTGDNGGVNPTSGAGTGTLRQAIVDANAAPGTNANPDLIQFDIPMSDPDYNSTTGAYTITLNGTALPDITSNLTIAGPGASNLIISGNNQSGIFMNGGGGEVSISGLTIEDGNASYGGGIYNYHGTMTVSNCTVSNNTASVFGGGLYNGEASLTVNDCCVENNSDNIGNNPPFPPADLGGGGGIYNDDIGGVLTVSNSTVTDNTVDVELVGGGSFGGGIYNGYNLNVINSTITNNTVTGPGSNGSSAVAAIWNPSGTLTVSGSTISDNTGAGISVYSGGSQRTITDTTISGNSGAGITVNGGTMTVNNCGILNNSGSGIYNFVGNLTVSNSNIEGNTGSDGAGIWNSIGTVKLSKSIISGNTGGIVNGDPGTVTVNSCSIFGNESNGGGGVYNSGGTVTLTNSSILDNTGLNLGGGIFNSGLMTVSNCTIAGNTAGFFGGSGIEDSVGTLTVTNSTIADNSGPEGGGAINEGPFSSGGPITLNNTIVANNTGGDLNLGNGGSFSGSNDLIGDGSGLSDFTNSLQGNPLLAPLGYYGGPTETMALLPGSPAIDAGSNALVPAGVTTDQRGQPRIVNGTVDIGAFESQGFSLTASSGNNQTAFINTNFPNALTVTVTPNNPLEPVNGGVIPFTAPNTGASAILSANTATISGGTASVMATSNGIGGSYTVTASASGASKPASFSLTNAVYNFSGFLPPLSNGLSFGGNRTIPIKFTLSDDNGNPVTSLSAVTSLQIQALDDNGNPVGAPFTPASTNKQGLQFSGGQYQFNWQTKGLAAGSYQIVLKLADGTTHTQTIQLTASGNGANAQAADGSDVSDGSTAGQLLGGDVGLYVDNSNGDLTPDELARIQEAVNAADGTIAPYGVAITEVTDPTQANVTLSMGTNSAVGGFGQGILGCYTTTGTITLIQGWNWYAGADPTQIGASQYDFQTTVTHELGHALGLGESSVTTSAMYGTLTPGTTIRTLTTADLNIPYDDGSSDAQRAAVPPVSGPVSIPSNGQGIITPSNPSISSSGSPLSPADQLLADLALFLCDVRNAYQSELSSMSAMWWSADTLALQRLDALLSMEAGAMGLSKNTLMGDFLLAS